MKSVPTQGKKSAPSSTLPHSRHILRTIGTVVVLIIIGGIVIDQIAQLIVKHSQQARFNNVKIVLSDFQTDLNQALGSSITNMNKASSCYYNSPQIFSKGTLFCDRVVTGTVSAQPSNVKARALQIDSLAHAALQKSGKITSLTPELLHQRVYAPNGSIYVADSYMLYGHDVDCTITVDTPFTVGNVNGPNYQVKSLAFRLDCWQESGRAFFPISQP